MAMTEGFMTRISKISLETATSDARQGLDEELRKRGRLTNLKLIQAHSPVALRVYGEWFALKDALAADLSDREIFILSLAISEAQSADIPVGFFRRALAQSGHDPDQLTYTETEALLAEVGAAVGADAHSVSDALWERLRHRYNEAALVNLSAFAGIMIATTVFANIVRAEPDDDVIPYLKPRL